MKNTLIIIGSSIVLIAAVVFYVSQNKSDGTVQGTTASNAVSIVDGTQYIDIKAGTGYSPNKVTAKAGMPTILRMTTKGAFDCSASVTIAALNYQKQLQPTGMEEIPIPIEKAQGTLRGVCAMGMYNFQISFQS